MTLTRQAPLLLLEDLVSIAIFLDTLVKPLLDLIDKLTFEALQKDGRNYALDSATINGQDPEPLLPPFCEYLYKSCNKDELQMPM